VALKNRWLNEAAPASSGRDSGFKAAGRGVAMAAAFAAVGSAVALNIDRIADVLNGPRLHTQQQEALATLHTQRDTAQTELSDLAHRLTLLENEDRHRREKEALAAAHAKEIEELRQALAAKEAQLGSVPINAERRAPAPDLRGRRTSELAMHGEGGVSTVSRHEARRYRYEYRVLMRHSLTDDDRQYYRRRFSKNCNVPPSLIHDLPQGFGIPSDGCRDGTFDGVVPIDSTTNEATR
jgi:hypothetical protein